MLLFVLFMILVNSTIFQSILLKFLFCHKMIHGCITILGMLTKCVLTGFYFSAHNYFLTFSYVYSLIILLGFLWLSNCSTNAHPAYLEWNFVWYYEFCQGLCFLIQFSIFLFLSYYLIFSSICFFVSVMGLHQWLLIHLLSLLFLELIRISLFLKSGFLGIV